MKKECSLDEAADNLNDANICLQPIFPTTETWKFTAEEDDISIQYEEKEEEEEEGGKPARKWGYSGE